MLLTARSEAIWRENAGGLPEALRRLAAYAEAGADVLFAPGVKTAEEVAEVVRVAGPLPVNVVVGAPGLTRRQLEDLGVKRISTGAALARAAWGALMRAARDIAENGRFDAFAGHARRRGRSRRRSRAEADGGGRFAPSSRGATSTLDPGGRGDPGGPQRARRSPGLLRPGLFDPTSSWPGLSRPCRGCAPTRSGGSPRGDRSRVSAIVSGTGRSIRNSLCKRNRADGRDKPGLDGFGAFAQLAIRKRRRPIPASTPASSRATPPCSRPRRLREARKLAAIVVRSFGPLPYDRVGEPLLVPTTPRRRLLCCHLGLDFCQGRRRYGSKDGDLAGQSADPTGVKQYPDEKGVPAKWPDGAAGHENLRTRIRKAFGLRCHSLCASLVGRNARNCKPTN